MAHSVLLLIFRRYQRGSQRTGVSLLGTELYPFLPIGSVFEIDVHPHLPV